MRAPRDIVKGQWEASQRGQLTIWTIYDRPKDHPEGFIARRFEVGEGKTVATADTINGKLDDIRMALERAGLVNIRRQEGDEPQIVESWI
jgi:hypothetical protein